MQCNQGVLSGRSVVVIGATSGSGLHTAQTLVERGARVVVTGRNPDKLETATRALGSAAQVVRSDAASPADVDELAGLVASELGQVDGVFINAGSPLFKTMADMTESDFDDVVAANMKGPYFALRGLAPLVRDGGAIVVTTSVANRLGGPGLSAYAAAKAAARAMVRSAAQELLPRGVRVNAVSPGPIDSGALERAMSGEAATRMRAAMTEANPMRRFGRAEEIAAAVRFLLFEATFTTAEELTVDGGAAHLVAGTDDHSG